MYISCLLWSHVRYWITGPACLLRDRVLLCLILVRAYLKNAASEQYVETKGNSCRTAFLEISGNPLLRRGVEAERKRFTGLRRSFRFLSADMSRSCWNSLSGRSKSCIEAENEFRSQFISFFFFRIANILWLTFVDYGNVVLFLKKFLMKEAFPI